MGKIDIEFIPDSRQGSVGCVQQGICGKVIRRPEPFAPEYSPKCLCKIEMRAVWWEKEEKQSSLFPNGSKLLHELTSVDTRIVKNYKCILADTERKLVDKVSNLVSGHVLGSRESLISVIAVNHTEKVKPQTSFGREKAVKKTLLSKILEPFLTCWGVQINNHSHNHNRNHRKNKYSSIHNLMF